MITYTESTDEITPRKLAGFFVGWSKPPSPETHLNILRQSTHVILAVDDETNLVVGFINALSDDILSAYIPLLEVLPDYQRRGIGRELVRRMLTRLGELYMIDLTCDRIMRGFYEEFGLQSYQSMIKRNYAKQAGQI